MRKRAKADKLPGTKGLHPKVLKDVAAEIENRDGNSS